MLRFNTDSRPELNSAEAFQYILCYGSTWKNPLQWPRHKEFQYILCYGSTPLRDCIYQDVNYFNTSYVTVQPPRALRGFFGYRISIHLMLRFNAVFFRPCEQLHEISIHLMLRFNLLLSE